MVDGVWWICFGDLSVLVHPSHSFQTSELKPCLSACVKVIATFLIIAIFYIITIFELVQVYD